MPNPFTDHIDACVARGLAYGALQPIESSEILLPGAPIDCVARVASNLARKDQGPVPQSSPRRNPFLPHDPDLLVADISPTHLCVLNKFNVLARHLLIITRQFEDQETVLTEADFEAWWWSFRQADGLGFYNSGRVAGASQPHKHMQWVGLPLSRVAAPIPVEALFNAKEPAPQRLPAYPPVHCCAALNFSSLTDRGIPRRLHELYFSMLTFLKLDPLPGQSHPREPYNLLLTRRWMLVVPRTREHHAGISLNGLAFAGSFFVRNEEELQRLEKAGAWNALVAVTRD